MKKLFQIFFWGMIISFLGSLPLGVMNITATHISIQQGVKAGLIYATGSMLVEILVVRLTLVGMNWLARYQKIFFFLEVITTGLLFLIAAGSFIAAYKMKVFSNALLPAQFLDPFRTGAILSATNPLHISFWLGWSTILLNKQVLEPRPIQYNWFVTGIGTGTILGFMVFIYAGAYFVAQITKHQNILNWIIGILLFGTAIFQAKKIFFVPATVRYGKMLNHGGE